MTTLIDEREKRTKRRKDFKKRIDGMIDLSCDTEKKTLSVTSTIKGNKIRLLDEGAVVGGGEYVDFFIKKGTLEKFLAGENEYLDNIDDEYLGHVNLGHLDFATFPFILGEFKLDDMELVEIENERHGLDIEVRLDEESVFVKELARQPYDIAVSGEFYYHEDRESSEDLGFLVVDEVLITAYGLVGEPGNVNSDGLNLNGGNKVEKEIKQEVLEEEILEEEKELDITEEIEDDKEDIEEVDGEEVKDEEVEEKDEEVADEEADDEEGGMLAINEVFEEMQKVNAELTSKVEALEKKVTKLQRKLKAKNEEIDKFAEKFSGISVSLGLTSEDKKEEKNEVTSPYRSGDGVGGF